MRFRSKIARLACGTLFAALAAALTPAPAAAQSQEALARRDRSHQRLAAEKVPINPHLPLIEDSREALRRSADDIGVRALALLAVSMKASGAPEDDYRSFIADFDLAEAFSPEEAAFMADSDPDDGKIVAFSWRFEAACTLLWSIGLLERLDRPEETCTGEQVAPLVAGGSRSAFFARAKLRSIGEILDQADLIYRYRWALVDLRVGGAPVPDWLSPDIAMERHHAFNWLVQNPPEPWDEISLDT